MYNTDHKKGIDVKSQPCRISHETLSALRMGDQEAYAEVYTHYQKPVLDFLYALTRSRVVAEDITHNVFIGVWESREKLDPTQGIRRYLFTVAKHMAMRYFRHKKVVKNHFEYAWLQPIEEIAPEELLFVKEADLMVEIAISNMPKMRKKIFEMYYKNGLSYDLIADTLALNKATVANHISHAKKDVRKILQIGNEETICKKSE